MDPHRVMRRAIDQPLRLAELPPQLTDGTARDTTFGGDSEDEVAVPGAGSRSHPRELVRGEELRHGRADLASGEGDRHETLGALGLRHPPAPHAVVSSA